MFLAYKDMWDMPIDPVDGLEKVKEGESAPKRVGHFVGNIVYAIIFIAFKIAFRYKVEGIENLRQFDGKRGAVVIGNHASYLDPAFLWIAARPKQWVRFMARDNMFANAGGLAGQVISRVGAFPIKRGSADRTAIKRASAMLKRGESVGIFPEGTRRDRGTAAPELHGGAAFIARMAKCPSFRRLFATWMPLSVRASACISRRSRWCLVPPFIWKTSTSFPRKTVSMLFRGTPCASAMRFVTM